MFNKLFKKGISKDQVLRDDSPILTAVDLESDTSNLRASVYDKVLTDLLMETISDSLLDYIKGPDYSKLLNEFTSKYPEGVSRTEYKHLKDRYKVLHLLEEVYKVDICGKFSAKMFTIDELLSKLTDDAMEQQNG